MSIKMSSLSRARVGLAMLAFGLFFGNPVHAAVVNVSVINFAFSPAVANINVNDSVVWVWAGQNHNVTSTSSPQAWPTSPTESTPFSFTNQFTSAGSFPYVCTVHGFTGTINVVAPNLPPTVTITNPAPNSVFAVPANIKIVAMAADSDGSVTNVQFLLGTTVLGNKTAAPYSIVASNVVAGGKTITAIATDNLGARSTNSISISVVTPVATAISLPRLSSTNFVFTFNATVGLNYIVQATTALVSSNWADVFTNAPASNITVTVQLPISARASFYRVGRLPNP